MADTTEQRDGIQFSAWWLRGLMQSGFITLLGRARAGVPGFEFRLTVPELIFPAIAPRFLSALADSHFMRPFFETTEANQSSQQ